MAPIPDLVKLSSFARLDATFHTDPDYTEHVDYVLASGPDRKKIQQKERWKRQKRIGRGGFRTVYLERCILGNKQGDLRAVKEIVKQGCGAYDRELEAMALFSHFKVAHDCPTHTPVLESLTKSQHEQNFVNSFG